MNKLLYISTAFLLVSACGNYNTKQTIDETYYKRTQGIAWPTEQAKPVVQTKVMATKSTTSKSSVGSSVGHSSASSSVPSADAPDAPEKWHDATEPAPKMAVPAVPEKKVQCVKKDDAYTCRYGQQICGRGCQSDGSNCYEGYCQKSECDDVLGQKWNWVRNDSNGFGCQHPTYKIICLPKYGGEIWCFNGKSYACGWDCNKNGTDCNHGDNDCWDKYR